MFPLCNNVLFDSGEDLSDSDSSSSSEDEGVNNVEELDERKLALINETLLNPQSCSALGAWEKHTKVNELNCL